jgi:hypothetical protein
MSKHGNSKTRVIQYDGSYIEFTEPIFRNDIIVYNEKGETKYAYIVIPEKEFVLKNNVKYAHIFGSYIKPKIYIYDMFESIRLINNNISPEQLYKMEKTYENIIYPFFEIPCVNISGVYKGTDESEQKAYADAVSKIYKEHTGKMINKEYSDTYNKYIENILAFKNMQNPYVSARSSHY